MHMGDALLSVPVGVAFWGIAGLAIGVSARRFTRDAREGQDSPLVGVMAAFVFAAQMINVTIPGTGSSGHLAGGTLLAILLGPARAIICMAAVLLVQALFFADGGLLAFGCNLCNLGLIGALGGWTIYRALAGSTPTARKQLFAAGIAAWCAVLAGSAMVPLQTTLSGRADLPFMPFLSGMVLIHAGIGLLEALVTANVITFLLRNRPTLFPSPANGTTRSLTMLIPGLGLAALVIAGGISLLASTLPDGLEFVLEKFSGAEEATVMTSSVHRFLANLQEWTAFMPDYNGKLAGVIGSLLIFCALGGGLWFYMAMKRAKAIDAPEAK